MTATMTAAVLALALLGAARPASATNKQILFFTKSSGFEHTVIKVSGAGESHGWKILKGLGDTNGFEVTHSKDGRIFSADGIARFDAFVFYASGDLTKEGTDKNPPLTAEGKTLFLDSVRRGKGFVGIHAASDAFHSPGSRFVDNDGDADPYIAMLGGEFIRHGQQQKATVFCADTKFPGFARAGRHFPLLEEWYSFKNLAPDLHVLLWLGTWGLKNVGGDSVYRRPPYPVAWARLHGRGRVFYTALGHREDVWTNPLFHQMLVGAIKWASGAAQANVSPNVASVTPGFAELPPDDGTADRPRPSPLVSPEQRPAP